jgi:hypothetical protein
MLSQVSMEWVGAVSPFVENQLGVGAHSSENRQMTEAQGLDRMPGAVRNDDAP